jgi:hypothetical protein
MFTKHVTAKLSAYCNDELAKEESQRVAEHLLSCQGCREEYDAIKLGVQLANRLPQLSAPDSLWSEIENLLDAQTAKPVAQTKRPRFAFNFGWQKLAFASAMLFVIFAVASVIWYDANLSNQLEAAKTGVIGNTPTAEVPGLPNIEIAPQNGSEKGSIASNDDRTNEDANSNGKKDKDRRTNNSTNELTNLATWEVARLEGSPVVGDSPLADKGKIAVGQWLETDGASRAKITVGEIGHVDVAPNTRIQLVQARENEHRLALAVGEMHAKIYAPPRIFFVNTPTAQAIDLGCEYTLTVDDEGTSILRVKSGWVAFVCNGRESLVPEGARSITRKGFAPGTPYFEDATDKFKQAINRFDFEKGGKPELDVLIKEAHPRDTLTLWHLLSRVGNAERIRLYNRIVEYVPLPDDVTREGILRLDKEMLRLWKLDLEVEWYAQPKKEEK